MVTGQYNEAIIEQNHFINWIYSHSVGRFLSKLIIFWASWSLRSRITGSLLEAKLLHLNFDLSNKTGCPIWLWPQIFFTQNLVLSFKILISIYPYVLTQEFSIKLIFQYDTILSHIKKLKKWENFENFVKLRLFSKILSKVNLEKPVFALLYKLQTGRSNFAPKMLQVFFLNNFKFW